MTTNLDAAHALEKLASAHFKDLSKAELAMLQDAASSDSATCDPNNDGCKDSQNDPRSVANWGRDREIRGELIRWLCIEPKATTLVDPSGFTICGAKITSQISLSYLTVPFGFGIKCSYMEKGIDIVDATIPSLDLGGTWLHSITADGVDIKRDAWLRKGFHADGPVRFTGAHIGGDLSFAGATVINPPKLGDDPSVAAIQADSVEVDGSVFLSADFHVVGQVALQGARIGQNLVCYGGTFSNPPIKCIHSSGTAIDAGYAVIGGQAYLCSAPGNPFQVIGRVTLRGSRITQQLYWRGVVQPENASLDLTNASTDDFQDDEDSWRKLPSLTIDGFKYRTIDSTSYLPNPPDRSRTVALRLDWIRKQRPVKPQPYRQYAQALTESGDEDGATKVLIELEAMLKADHWLESAVLESTIGYGYAPLRSFWWLGGLTALGWIILRREGVAKSMVPSDKDAYALEKNNEPPAFQPRFVPFVYSLENSLPIVKLGQTDKWQIDSSLMKVEDSSGNWFWRFWRLLKLPAFRVQCFLWFQILAGWALATLFAAGVTGLVHSK